MVDQESNWYLYISLRLSPHWTSGMKSVHSDFWIWKPNQETVRTSAVSQRAASFGPGRLNGGRGAPAPRRIDLAGLAATWRGRARAGDAGRRARVPATPGARPPRNLPFRDPPHTVGIGGTGRALINLIPCCYAMLSDVINLGNAADRFMEQ